MLQEAPNGGIVVLTGGNRRIAVGFDMLQKNIAPKMFISGVGTGVRLDDILPGLSEDMAQRVFLGRSARDTLGNAEEVAEWLGATELSPRIVLVTAHYHLPRALGHLSRRMPEVTWVPVAAHPEALPLEHWYRYPLGWRVLSSELAKFLGSRLLQVLR